MTLINERRHLFKYPLCLIKGQNIHVLIYHFPACNGEVPLYIGDAAAVNGDIDSLIEPARVVVLHIHGLGSGCCHWNSVDDPGIAEEIGIVHIIVGKRLILEPFGLIPCALKKLRLYQAHIHPGGKK